MIVLYGIIGENGTHIDISKTERGAKNFATRNNYNKVSKRVGYTAYVIAEKVNKKWISK